MKLDLMKLFDGYVKNYHTFNLTVHHGKHSFTMTEIEYFSRLGSMLGYLPYTEDTAGGICRPMDLSWWGDFDGEYWHDLILHLERENLFDKDEITLDMLFCDREVHPINVIGIMNVPSMNRIKELLKLVGCWTYARRTFNEELKVVAPETVKMGSVEGQELAYCN